jgi:hypothetical protein
MKYYDENIIKRNRFYTIQIFFIRIIAIFYKKIIRFFIFNPVFNFIDFVLNIQNLGKAIQYKKEIKKKIQNLNSIEGLIELIKEENKKIKYRTDYFSGIGDYTSYKLVFFMKMEDDCDTFALYVHWLVKWFKKSMNKKKIKAEFHSELISYLINWRYDIKEMMVNHYIYHIHANGKNHIFSSGVYKNENLFEHTEYLYGEEGIYTKAINRNKTKKVPYLRALIITEKKI